MKDRMTMPGMLLLLAEVIAVAALAIVSTRHFGVADGLCISASYLVAYLVPLFVLKRSRGTSIAAQAVLLAIAIFMSIVAYDCLVSWSAPEGYSLQRPNLDGDAREYYKWALHVYEGVPNDEPGDMFLGFQLMMLGLWKVFGLSVIWPQAMNMMFTMLSVVLTGLMTRRVLAHRVTASPRTLVLSAMALMCLLLFYLTSGVTILKEGGTFLSITMGGYALSSMVTVDEERQHLWWDICVLVLACLLMAFVRTTFLYFLALGILVMTVSNWRRDWVLSVCMLALIFGLFVLSNYFVPYSFARHVEIVDGGWNMERTFNLFYSKSIFGFYFLYSPWHRLLFLPVTMGLQFILPLPFRHLFEPPYLLSFLSRMTYGWYLFGGTALFYCLFVSWRRGMNIGVWTWWPVLIYIGEAYVMGGMMARYMLPVQPLMVPMVLFVLCHLHEGRWRRGYLIWMISLIVLVFAALMVYYYKVQ